MSLNGRTTEIGRTNYSYLTRSGDEVIKTRIEYADGHKRFEWPKGTKTEDVLLYNADLLDDPRFADEVVDIGEGEKTADALVAAGLCAVTFCGGSSQRKFGEAARPLAGRHVRIWPDSDKTGLDFVCFLIEELVRVGVASITVVEPIWGMEKGTDAADLLEGLDPREARAVVAEWSQQIIEWKLPATDVEKQTGSISAADMDEPPPRRWLIEGIVPERWPTILYGDGGVGKTTLSNHLAVCLALGLPWFGRNTTPCNVLIVDAELDAEEFARRIWPITRGLGLAAPPRGVYYWRLPGPLGDDEVTDRLFAIADQRNVSLIIIDSLTLATYSSDQYVANDLAAVIFRFTRQGVATMFLDHHARQGRMDEGSRVDPYGSVMKRNLARSSIYLQTSGPGMVRLSANKASFASAWEPFTTEVRFQGAYPNETISYHSIAVNDPRLVQAESRSKDDEIMDTIQEYMESDPEEYGQGVKTTLLSNVIKGINHDALRMRCMRLEKSHRLLRTSPGTFAIPYLVRPTSTPEPE